MADRSTFRNFTVCTILINPITICHNYLGIIDGRMNHMHLQIITCKRFMTCVAFNWTNHKTYKATNFFPRQYYNWGQQKSRSSSSTHKEMRHNNTRMTQSQLTQATKLYITSIVRNQMNTLLLCCFQADWSITALLKMKIS